MRYDKVLTFLVSREQEEYLRGLSRETGKSIGELLRQLIDEQIRAENSERVLVELDKRDLHLLQDIYADTNIYDVGEMVSTTIASLHVLVKSGVWKLLKPLPELARLVEAETVTQKEATS
jgi:HEPN domain-containing protein